MLRLLTPLIPDLRRYARSLLKDRVAADDLVQDCLERTVKHWHQRRGDRDTRSWVFTILHNLAISSLRRSARRQPHISVDDLEESAMATRAPQEGSVRQQEVLAALDRLPEDQRAVLLLVGVEEMSYAETAAIMGVPIGTVMSRLSRARDHLHRLLDEDEAGSARPLLRRVK